MHFSLHVCCLLLVLGYGSARYLDQNDEDPNTLRAEEQEELPAVTEELPVAAEELAVTEEQPEEEDSCEDFPPASCIRHFSTLPGNLQRSPFSLRTTSDFTHICDAYKKALLCFKGFTSRCQREQSPARQFIDQMSALTEQCDNPQIQQDVIAALDCGRRMSAVHERCIRETRFIPQLKDLSSERMLKGDENSLRDLCCGMRYHKACYMDQVTERCGEPAFEANQRLESIIMRGFSCDALTSSDCPAIRP